MKIPSARDEGEPGGFTNPFYNLQFFFCFFLLFISYCQSPKTEINAEQPAANSILVKKQTLTQPDSLPKAVVQKKKIYLTFDDGPNKGTMNVLNAVKKDSIPASFFIVGRHTDNSPAQQATWQALKADSAIELCNHGYSHASNRYRKYYQHPGDVVKDMQFNKEQLSLNNNIIRMPGRNAWRIDSIDYTDIPESKAAVDSVHAAGFDVMGWDLEWMFNNKKTGLVTSTDLLLRQIKNKLETGNTKTRGHLVLLVHDQAFRSNASIAQLHYLFRELKNNPDFELLLADNYPGIKK